MLTEATVMALLKPAIEKFITNFVTPKLESFASTCQLKYDELLIPKREKFMEYLFRSYEKYCILNALSLKNQQLNLKDLYIPLTICKNTVTRQGEENVKIDGYPQDLIQKYSKILITDTAGMGKSTLVKRVFLDIIENGYGIPIFIEMRRLNKQRTLLMEIKNQIDSLGKDFDLQLLYRFIQTGEFIFILDGYDEISLTDRVSVTDDVQDFISRADKNVFIMTSRPEDALACFGDFQRFNINPLRKSEAYELLRKYDYQGETSRILIAELKTGKYNTINEFLKNPLLVSLLFIAFDFKQTIPLKKHIFYRQVYYAYFDSHDLTKGGGFIHQKKSGLDTDDFDRILRCVGYRCLREQKIEFDKDLLLKLIEEAKNENSDLNFNASDFFDDILHSVPLFCCDGQYYKWVHKSIQEYFAAQYIYKDAKENQDKILSAMFNSKMLDKYLNLLDIYYDIDFQSFAKNITLPLLKQYCSFFKNEQKELLAIDQKSMNNRINIIFLQEICIFKHSLNESTSSDIINHAIDQVQPYMMNMPNSFTICHGNFVTACYTHPQRRLFNLLYSKNPSIFCHLDRKIGGDVSFIKPNDIYKIDVNSFEDSQEYYNIINNYILHEPNVLDYEACRSEKEKLEANFNRKKNYSTIIDGI